LQAAAAAAAEREAELCDVVAALQATLTTRDQQLRALEATLTTRDQQLRALEAAAAAAAEQHRREVDRLKLRLERRRREELLPAAPCVVTSSASGDGEGGAWVQAEVSPFPLNIKDAIETPIGL
jgi:hypothetical protein